MSLTRNSSRFRSFAFYLGMGYLLVYVLCAIILYFFMKWNFTQTARQFDQQDAVAECEELVERLNENASGQMLAEAVTMERYPPSTIFIVRVLNTRGQVEYTLTWPNKIDVPEWEEGRWNGEGELPKPGLSEFILKGYNRSIQVQTARANDGRILQVGKGSFLELDNRATLKRILVIFAIVSTLFSLISALFLIVLTLRPINRITLAMTQIIETGAYGRGSAPVKSPIAELDRLGQLFTIMTEKYANLIQAMRQTMDHVAHDFRTPLTRIRGSAEIALGHFAELPPDVSEALADIIEDCDRAKLQLQNLMDARELESGFVKLNLQTLDVTYLMTEMTDLYGMVAEEKGIHFKTVTPPAGLTIRADRAWLARALGNLVDNAIKYTPRGGSVMLSGKRINGGGVQFTVSDTGIGIPPDEQELVWQRLFRGKKAQESEKGLGLGLNIVQIIVQAHHGTVQLKSDGIHGTTFILTFPEQ
ncbi:MAG: HAMP domain-containing histidine kinase [Kiritimatiellae bacterium]|nr:HAMP domain-containing histidine kinase [Kiritimatiellia bacterium]